MTPQESKMLQDLIARVDSTRLEEKDPDAAQQVEQWTARNRDAAYILAQTVLVQNYALEQAQAQIRALQQQPRQEPAKTTSFLGSLFGHKEETTPNRPQQQTAYPQQPPAPAQQGYTPVPQYGQQGYPAQAYAPQAGGGSSFLRSAASTAAGVAAGALAFEGVESLMHGFGHAAGFGGGGSGGGEFGSRPEETVINNYYDGNAPGGAGSANADLQQCSNQDSSGLNTQQDLADDVNVGGDDTQLAADNDLPTLDDNTDSYDDASLDDSSLDDGGGGDFS